MSMASMGKDLLNVFRKPRTIIFIIVVLTGLYVAGLVIPQKVFFASRAHYESWKALYPVFSAVVEYLQLNEIYTAPVTVLFLALFFLDLLIVITSRVPIVLRKMRLRGGGADSSDLQGLARDGDAAVIDLGRDEGARVSLVSAKYFRKRLWTVLSSRDGRGLIAMRNRYSSLGFLFFHLSFLLCLGGALLIVYTRFSGNLVLTEGEDFFANIAQFRRINREAKIFKELPKFGIRVEKVDPSYEGTVGTNIGVKLHFTLDSKETDATIRTNYPLKEGPLSLIVKRIGIAPLFVLKERGGKQVGGGYYVLNVFDGAEDSFDIDKLPYRFMARFYPDYEVVEGKERSRSRALKNPMMALKILRGAKQVYSGNVPIGGSATFDAYKLEYLDNRYWVDFLVIREYGNLPMFAGFIIGAAGLMLRLIFYQKEISLYIHDEDGQVCVYLKGRSDYYPHLFQEELQGLSEGLRKSLDRRGTGSPSGEREGSL